MMAEDSESAASQQSLELDDQDTCGIDGDNEEENEYMQGWVHEGTRETMRDSSPSSINCSRDVNKRLA